MKRIKFDIEKIEEKIEQIFQESWDELLIDLLIDFTYTRVQQRQLAHLFYTLEAYPDVLEDIVHLLINGRHRYILQE